MIHHVLGSAGAFLLSQDPYSSLTAIFGATALEVQMSAEHEQILNDPRKAPEARAELASNEAGVAVGQLINQFVFEGRSNETELRRHFRSILCK